MSRDAQSTIRLIVVLVFTGFGIVQCQKQLNSGEAPKAEILTSSTSGIITVVNEDGSILTINTRNGKIVDKQALTKTNTTYPQSLSTPKFEYMRDTSAIGKDYKIK